MRKKLLAAILSAVMTISMVPMSVSADTKVVFNDVSAHWAKDKIYEAVNRGILNGMSDWRGTYFAPDNLMTREQFCTMVTKALSVQPNTTGVNATKFCDVVATEWYVPYVAKAVAAGIIEGTTSKEKDGYDTFGIGLMITREQAAKIMSSIIDPNKQLTYDEMLAGQAKYEKLKDTSKIDSWAKAHVEKLFVRGYMQGSTNPDGSTSFKPTDALTRAEAATLILNVVKGESKLLGPKQDSYGVTTPTTTQGGVTSGGITTGSGITTGTAIVTGNIFTHKVGSDIKNVKSYTAESSSKGCKCNDNYAFTEGSGKKSDPYIIRKADQLEHIREHLGEGIYFVLANDITIKTDYCKSVNTKNVDWTEGNFEPLGNHKTPFEAHFDGNGHSISGLNMQGKNENGGLFGYVAAGATIEGLTIEDSTINGTLYTGAIAGYCEGTIDYCTVAKDVKVNGTYNVGGIVGYTTDDVTNCKNYGKVTGTRTAVGGIAGSVFAKKATVENCENRGEVIGASNVGGIVGSLAGTKDNVVLTKSSNYGSVEATETAAGGIVGEASKSSYDGEVSYCYNEGAVSGKGNNGGIAGTTGKYAEVQYNQNKGLVSGSGAGGIVGVNSSQLKLCINAGEVTANSEAGGIAASQDGEAARVDQCYNSGTVSCKNVAGGIVGENTKRVFSCYNIGSINADTYAGGIAGRNSSTIQACYNLGKLSGKVAGGQIVGLNKGVINGVFWAKDNSLSGIGMSDTVMTQGVTRALTTAQLQGEVFDATGLVKGTFSEVLNRYDKEGVWGQTAANGYPTLLNMFIK